MPSLIYYGLIFVVWIGCIAGMHHEGASWVISFLITTIVCLLALTRKA